MRILVCDDDKACRRAIVEILSGEGFETCEAGGGYEAIKVVRKTRVDLGFFDWGLPDLDGPSTIRRLREEDFIFPFVLMSGEKKAFAETITLPSGVVAFLSKPLGVEDVRRVIYKVFGSSP